MRSSGCVASSLVLRWQCSGPARARSWPWRWRPPGSGSTWWWRTTSSIRAWPSLDLTRLPSRLRHVYPALALAVRGLGRIAPRVPVPFEGYLDITRVCRDEANAEYFRTDPLGRRSYPLGFMATLIGADLSGMRDGGIRCPVLVIAGRDDPLFPLAYTQQVFDRLVAPAKELLILESRVHLLFNEDLAVVLPPLLERLTHLRPERARTSVSPRVGS